MDAVLIKFKNIINIKTIILDLFLITAIYFVPTISHFLNIPVYLFEPMRIIIILSFVHTNKLNSYLLAVTLPLVSFLFSGHPAFPKIALVMFELIINVWIIFYLFNLLQKNPVFRFEKYYRIGISFAVFSSIVISKIFYYSLKYLFVYSLLIKTELLSTPLIIQFITTFSLCLYVFFTIKSDHIKREV